MESIKFLNKIGVFCTKASDVKAGDIVARANCLGNNPENTVRLFYVERVVFNCEPPCFLPHVPRVTFLPPHVGLIIKNEKIFRHYIISPTWNDYQHSWGEYKPGKLEEEIGMESDEDLISIIKKEVFDMYLVKDERYKKLGQLIPKVDSRLTFLYQTLKGEEDLYRFVEEVETDLEKVRKIEKDIEQKCLIGST